MPNFQTLFPSRLVKSLNPTGVLAVYIKSAKDLKLEDSFVKKMFGYDKPDTYVKTQLGMAKFQTEPVMNDANPTFKAKGTGSSANWFELPLDTLEASLFGPVHFGPFLFLATFFASLPYTRHFLHFSSFVASLWLHPRLKEHSSPYNK